MAEKWKTEKQKTSAKFNWIYFARRCTHYYYDYYYWVLDTGYWAQLAFNALAVRHASLWWPPELRLMLPCPAHHYCGWADDERWPRGEGIRRPFGQWNEPRARGWGSAAVAYTQCCCVIIKSEQKCGKRK